METVQQNQPYLVKLIEQEAKRKRRRAKIEKAITNFLTTQLLNFLGGWEFMLAVGVIHAEWIPQLPTIGYWWALLIVFLLRRTFSAIKYDKAAQS